MSRTCLVSVNIGNWVHHPRLATGQRQYCTRSVRGILPELFTSSAAVCPCWYETYINSCAITVMAASIEWTLSGTNEYTSAFVYFDTTLASVSLQCLHISYYALSLCPCHTCPTLCLTITSNLPLLQMHNNRAQVGR
jgi:hypothetical protein